MVEVEKVIRDSEYIKLSKMSKGYQWEIKIFMKDEENQRLADENYIKRLKSIEGKMQEEWGNE